MDERRALSANCAVTALERFAEYGEREAVMWPEHWIAYAGPRREIRDEHAAARPTRVSSARRARP